MSLKFKNILATGGAIALCLVIAIPALSQAQNATAPITRGQKIVMATHSFNVFISTPGARTPIAGPGCAAPPNPNAAAAAAAAARGGAARTAAPAAAAAGAGRAPNPAQAERQAARQAAAAATRAAAPPGPQVPLLTQLTNEKGLTGQEFLAVQMIGGSTPKQHWDQGAGNDCNNIAKAALATSGDKVDVFTMSPNAIMPEPAIDQFGDFVIAHNKNARIMVQNSWGAYDGHGSTPSVGGTGGGAFVNADRDKATLAEVQGWERTLAAPGGYLEKMRTQLNGINSRAGRQIAYVVPSGQAVYALREQVIAGKVPGLTKQSEMHRDPIGHPTDPTAHLVAYVWFAAMYRQSPVGLQVLVNKDDPTSAPRERLLQQIAWNTVISEPMSGVRGTQVALGQ